MRARGGTLRRRIGSSRCLRPCAVISAVFSLEGARPKFLGMRGKRFSSASDWKLAPLAFMRCDFGCFQLGRSAPEIPRDAMGCFSSTSDWKFALFASMRCDFGCFRLERAGLKFLGMRGEAFFIRFGLEARAAEAGAFGLEMMKSPVRLAACLFETRAGSGGFGRLAFEFIRVRLLSRSPVRGRRFADAPPGTRFCPHGSSLCSACPEEIMTDALPEAGAR